MMINVLKNIFFFFFFFAGVVFAEDEAPAESAAVGAVDGKVANAIYLPLKPTFIVNYGGAGRLKYLKIDVSVRLANSEAASAVRHHLPFIRNNLVMLFASQSDASLDSYQGKEGMRQDTLAEVRKILLDEEGIEADAVVDVFFDSLIVQK